MISESDLIDEYSFDGLGWARFDKDKRYRFRLGRKLTSRVIDVDWLTIWSPAIVRVVFLMLNPSVADAWKPDRTVERCMEFARRWGADVLEVVNLFAYISTDPKGLETACLKVHGHSPIGAAGGDTTNNMQILSACRGASRVVAAWGNGGGLWNRDREVRDLLWRHSIPLSVLRITKEGHPIHPQARGKSRVPFETQPVLWSDVEA